MQFTTIYIICLSILPVSIVALPLAAPSNNGYLNPFSDVHTRLDEIKPPAASRFHIFRRNPPDDGETPEEVPVNLPQNEAERLAWARRMKQLLSPQNAGEYIVESGRFGEYIEDDFPSEDGTGENGNREDDEGTEPGQTLNFQRDRVCRFRCCVVFSAPSVFGSGSDMVYTGLLVL
jgi:hypothetical protein